MNGIHSDRNFHRSIGAGVELDRAVAQAKIDLAIVAVEAQLGILDLPFKVPGLSIIALLRPGESSKPESAVAEPESADEQLN